MASQSTRGQFQTRENRQACQHYGIIVLLQTWIALLPPQYVLVATTKRIWLEVWRPIKL